MATIPSTFDSNLDFTEGWLSRNGDGFAWRMAPEWINRFRAAPPINWNALSDDPRATRVKSNAVRDVWRIDVGDHAIYVKAFREARGAARLKHLLLGTDAQREQRTAVRAARAGIRTIRPVAVAIANGTTANNDYASVLVTEGLLGAVDLKQRWLDMPSDGTSLRQSRNDLIDATAKLIADAHEANYVHADLHAGNILVQADRSGAWRATFVDLQNFRRSGFLSHRRICRNLAQLNQWFRHNGQLTDRIRFLDRYLEHRGLCQPGTAEHDTRRAVRRRYVDTIASAALRHARLLNRTRDRRISGNNRYFCGISLENGWSGHVYLQTNHPVPHSSASEMTFSANDWRRSLADPMQWVTVTDRRRIMKDSPSSFVCQGDLPIGDGTVLPVICKRSMPRNTIRRTQSLVRTSRAMLTWRRAYALLHRRIPTARPLAVLEQRRFGLLINSILITEFLHDADDLDTLLSVRLREMDTHRRHQIKRAVIARLVHVFCRFEEHGFTHRDMKAPNILVRWNIGPAETPEVFLIDLDGVRHWPRPRPRGTLRAITRLNVSLDQLDDATRTDRLRFLKGLMARSGRHGQDWKALWRNIADRADVKREKRRPRNARRLSR